MVILGCMGTEKLSYSQKLNLTKTIDHENKVMYRWHMHGWHVCSMINMWTKNGEARSHGNEETVLITKTKFNKVNIPRKWDHVWVTHICLTSTLHGQYAGQV